ncbi:MAG: molybdopterin-dependent oxidoreductase, partial [Actinomycetota bacterium]
PNDDFYRIDTALIVPQVAPEDFRLTIGGMVDNPLELTYDDLLGMDQVSERVTIACVSNEVGGGLVGNADWQGVLLSDLLEQAGVQPGAEQVVGRSIDRWTAGFPLEAATDGRPTMVAIGMNGEPLPIIHGFPARLIVPGLDGYVSATKWLSDISLTTWDGFDGYWVPLGWSKEGPVKTQSRIDVPAGDVDGPAVNIAGVAWAPTRGIDRVEVQIDDGDWQEAELGPGNSDLTWRQWVLRAELDPGRHLARVRATDGEGETQTDDTAPPRPDGATGWHARSFEVS